MGRRKRTLACPVCGDTESAQNNECNSCGEKMKYLSIPPAPDKEKKPPLPVVEKAPISCCSINNSRVVDSRIHGDTRWRRRKCKTCEKLLYSTESLIED